MEGDDHFDAMVVDLDLELEGKKAVAAARLEAGVRKAEMVSKLLG